MLARLLGTLLILAVLPSCGAIDSLKARRIAREGNDLYSQSDFKGAIAKYHESIALDPETPNVHLNLGYALFQIYRPESKDEIERNAAAEAADAFAKHLKDVPDDAKATTFRIKTLLRAAPSDPKIADQAYALFTGMLKQNPRDEEARQYLVSLLIDTKRYPQAVEYFGEELKQKPTDTDTMKILAIIADRSGLPDESINWYRKRAEATADPNTKASLYYELGTYLWNLLHYQPEKAGGFAGLRYADLGIEATKRAIALKADYAEAHVYANLLYLERSAREYLDFGKEVDQRIAFEFRTKAGLLLKKAKEEAKTTGTATAAEGGNK